MLRVLMRCCCCPTKGLCNLGVTCHMMSMVQCPYKELI